MAKVLFTNAKNGLNKTTVTGMTQQWAITTRRILFEI
jgi:hypothetical protein